MATNPFDEYCTTVLGTPRSWYKLDGATASSQPDTGDGTPSPITTAAGTVTTQVAGALQRDANSLAMDFGGGHVIRSDDWSANDFNTASTGTVSFFFKTSSNTTGTMLGTHPASGAFHWTMLPGGYIQFLVIEGGTGIFFITATSGWNDGRWHLIDTVCDGVNDNKIYIDGKEQPLTFISTGSARTVWLQNCLVASGGVAPFWIGDDSRGGFPFTGSIDEVQTWGESLTATQIAQKYAASQAANADVFLYTVRAFANSADIRLTNPTAAQGALAGTALAWVEQDDTASLAGSVVSGTDNIALAWTEDDDAAALTGVVLVSGTLAWTEADDTYALSGSVIAPDTISIAWTEADDTAALTGAVTVSGTIAWTEQNDTASLTGALSASGTIAWTEQNDTASITVFAGTFASIAWTESDDISALALTLTDPATVAWVEDDDVIGLVGTSQQPANSETYSGGYHPWLAAPVQRGAGWRRRERIRLGIIEDDEARAEEAARLSHVAQQELARAAAQAALVQQQIDAAQARQEAAEAALKARAEREALSLRQRRIARQRIEAMRREAEQAREQLRAIKALEKQLLIEIEELDVVFVATVLAIAA